MASIDIDFKAKTRRRPAASVRASRISSRDTGRTSSFSVDRAALCRLNAGQLLRSACLLLLCFGLSYLPRAQKSPPQGSVVEAVTPKS
jgi:hypothetical protein